MYRNFFIGSIIPLASSCNPLGHDTVVVIGLCVGGLLGVGGLVGVGGCVTLPQLPSGFGGCPLRQPHSPEDNKSKPLGQEQRPFCKR